MVWCLLLAATGILSKAYADEPAARAMRQVMTVDEAYQAIPHQKTRFDAAAAAMEPAEREFLDAFFGLSDIAVAERVEIQRALGTEAKAPDNYPEILRRLNSLAVPPRLAKAHALVTQAVDEQRQYLEGLKDGGKFDVNAPLVESSHQKLVAAYGELMQIYPAENAHNQQAFFDHLCALDFK